MAESLQIFDLEWKFIHVQDRKAFYVNTKSQYARMGIITQKIEVVWILMMNTQWRIYLQKRNSHKEENPWQYDKTVGWHVIAGNSLDITTTIECLEEIGVPVTIVSSETDFNVMKNIDTRTLCILRRIDVLQDVISRRVNKNDGTVFEQPYIAWIYIWYYDGPIAFRDWESTGIQTFDITELEESIQANPHIFTEDIQFLIKKYRHYLIPIQ